MKQHLSLLSALVLSVTLASAEDFLGGLIRVNVRHGGRRVFDDAPSQTRTPAPTPAADLLPHGYPPNLADLPFEERVRELARPRMIAVFREGGATREPEWRQNDGESWAKDYLKDVATQAASPRRNLFELDASLTNRAPEFERRMFAQQGKADLVDQLFLQARIAYAKSVALVLDPKSDSNRTGLNRLIADSDQTMARLIKAIAVDDQFGDAVAGEAKRRQLADLVLRGVILRSQLETLEATERLHGDSWRVCGACARLGFQGPGSIFMRSTVGALGVTEPASHGNAAIYASQHGHRFDGVIAYLKQEALKNAAEPALVARSVELARELQTIDELTALGRWDETQARCLALWERINAQPSTEASK